jgi:nucleotide-binding universal stress UspA family protein
MYRSILVPLDGSTFAEHALPLALSIARRAGATLRLVQVHLSVFPPFGDGGGTVPLDFRLDDEVRAQEAAYLASTIARLTAVAPTVPASTALLDGPTADVLCGQAIAAKADLVVMATHGRGALSRLWLGSVADKLVRKLPMPVLLVRPSGGAADLSADAALHRILIPLDGSELAEQILEPAAALGSLMGAEHQLLFVLEPALIFGPHLSSTALGQDLPLLRESAGQAQEYLESVAARLRARSLRVQTRLLVSPMAGPAILEEAAAQHCDLIALETHGRGGLARLVLGSVADKVIRGASTAVLVHHPAARTR